MNSGGVGRGGGAGGGRGVVEWKASREPVALTERPRAEVEVESRVAGDASRGPLGRGGADVEAGGSTTPGNRAGVEEWERLVEESGARGGVACD